MATVVHERLDVAPLSGFRLSWGGIWAGVLTDMGTLLFLTTSSCGTLPTYEITSVKGYALSITSEKRPLESEVVPSEVFLMVMLAKAMASPLSSTTRPVNWEKASKGKSAATSKQIRFMVVFR